MAVNKVVYGGDTLIDLTNDTVTANTLLAGSMAHGSDGTEVEGSIKTYTDFSINDLRKNIKYTGDYNGVTVSISSPSVGYYNVMDGSMMVTLDEVFKAMLSSGATYSFGENSISLTIPSGLHADAFLYIEHDTITLPQVPFAKYYSGSDAPSDTLGNDGDIYLRTT